jgi:hypothetical protein
VRRAENVTSATASDRTRAVSPTQTPMSVARLLLLSHDDLERRDIALLNLLCAEGLPGAERLDVDHCLSTLDSWANAVRRYVDDSYHQFQRSPADYFHDRGFFCFLSMVTLLKHPRGIGIRLLSSFTS